MKTTILITGQINGNYTLAGAIGGDRHAGKFNSITLTFNSKKDAVKAIRRAYNSLCADEPAMKGHFGGIRVNTDRTALFYDASQAIIQPKP